MRKMFLVCCLLFVLLLAGCAASGVDVLGKFTADDGSSIAYVRGWWRAPMDMDGSTVDRWRTANGKTELAAHDAGFDSGWGKKTVSYAVPAAIMGGSYAGGSALIRPSNVSQIGGGASQAQSARAAQAQGQVSTNSNINTNTQAQGQLQGQAQGQLQGQQQGQGQSTGLLSPVTVLP